MGKLATLDQVAHRIAAEKTAAENMSRAKVALLMGNDARSVFFATLAMRLRYSPCWDIGTAATDGKRLLYNPDFVNELKTAELVGVLAHEVLHCTNSHMTRRGDREPRLWNVAADLAINSILKDAGYALPANGCFAGQGQFAKYAPMLAAEEYYSLLQRDKHDAGGDDDDPGGCGGVIDAAESGMDANEVESDWQIATLQAAQQAKQKGTLPAGITRLVDEIAAPKVPWRDVLREFVRAFARNDYSWSAPNRRFIHRGLILPSLRSEELGEIMLAVDTSGSIDEELLRRFAAEMQGILDAYSCSLTIVYCDCSIQHVQTWQSTDGPLVIEAKGGGGTSHEPVWEWAAAEGYEPVACVCLTDMYTDFGSDPGFPVLWAATGDGPEPPFGRVVSID